MATLAGTAKILGTSHAQLPQGTTADRPIAIFRTVGSNTWTCPAGVTSVQVLLVGGGGGGGSHHGGGGGGGGVVYNSAVAVTPGTTYTFSVGDGGSGGIYSPTTNGTNGGNTTAFGLTAYGGGYGATYTNAGGSGASGGGPTNWSAGAAGGAQLYGQGFAAQNNNGSLNYAGGGGGAGGTSTGSSLNSGGPGVAYSITGLTQYYGGGGGAGIYPGYANDTSYGLGGRGGGGHGGNGPHNAGSRPYDGEANTGGGGGGVADLYQRGGRGGSGVVVVSTFPTTVNPVGTMRFNTTIGDVEVWDGHDWQIFIPFEGTITSQVSSPSRTGPTSITTPYTGDLAGRVIIAPVGFYSASPEVSGRQELTIPMTGWYRIKAFGAQGGCNSTTRGGGGAMVAGDFFLQAGERIRMLVGSCGATHPGDCDTGGGGGTYVLRAPFGAWSSWYSEAPQSLMLVAGGGGGASNASFAGNTAGSRFQNYGVGNGGKNGLAGPRGSDGRRGFAGAPGFAGDRSISFTNSNGSQDGGNPGGGYYDGGSSGSSNPTWGETTAGYSYLQPQAGGYGGTSNHPNAYGGFGGGGGGHGNCFISGGGGGGWSGGGMQSQYSQYHGGTGAGSYNAGKNQENISGINWKASGDGAMGRVEITRIR